jgi:hypothetical protein
LLRFWRLSGGEASAWCSAMFMIFHMAQIL